MSTLLDIKDLEVRFYTPEGVVRAVDGVSLDLEKGETLGVVGESGCGKTVTARSVMRLIPSPPGKIIKGSITFDDKDVLALKRQELLAFRGGDVSMIFQEPMTSLNPVFNIKDQLTEGILLHQDISREDAVTQAAHLLDLTGIPSAKERLDSFPHQLSGGMRQRVMIAMAISCNPQMLIADEPTTALDVTIQAQILEIMRNLKSEFNMGIMLITHDLGVVAEMADRVAVMYAGRVVEIRKINDLYADAQHPYTEGLLNSIPGATEERKRLHVIKGSVPNLLDLPTGCTFRDRCEHATGKCAEEKPELIEVKPGAWVACYNFKDSRTIAQNEIKLSSEGKVSTDNRAEHKDRKVLVKVENLVKEFKVSKNFLGGKGNVVHAVDGVSFTINQGEVFSLVGESGCGKTTTGRLMVGLEEPTGGNVEIAGQHFYGSSNKVQRKLRKEAQIIFQDPYSSLNPRMKVETIIGEGLRIHGDHMGRKEKEERIVKAVRSVGLEPYHLPRYPHEFSGGQRQRIGIARALILNPKFIVCDEPVSALDVSIQAQILNLMKDLQEEYNLTYLFIAHDLLVVKHLSDRVGVLYLGKLVELADKDELYSEPMHPYTQALLSASPKPDPGAKSDRIVLTGDIPSPINPPSGCYFRTRCNRATKKCTEESPQLVEISPGHYASCHYI